MTKSKIGIITLISLILVSLIFGAVVLAQPIFNGKSFDKFDKAEYVQDELIVKFKGDVKPFRVIKVPEGRIGEKIKEYLERADVEYAEPNYIAHALMVPNDPYYKYQWHLDNPVYGGIGMEEAWDIQTGSSSVIVAIVDTGIAYENYGGYCQAPDLAKTCFVQGYDFINGDTHPNDDNNHGTHVAGTVAQSTNNNLGVAGVAFNTCLMPVKVLNQYGSGSYANVANGIRYVADNGAKVINLSLGGSASSDTLRDAVKYAYEKGVTIIAACGNSNTNSCLYPAAYDDYVIAVGATQYDEKKAPYSSYGSSLDIVAPGGNTGVDQNGDGYGDGVLQQTFKSSSEVCNFAYYFFQGTSMAAPHVSGVAALLIANGITGPANVREVLQSTAEDLGTIGRDDTYGYGLVNAYAALNWRAAPSCTIDAECDDGLYCNGAETCQNAVCKAGTQVTCSALSNQCNDGVCDEATDSCIAKPKTDGTTCDDGLYCNVGETCQAGVCAGGAAQNCGDGVACTADSCNETSDTCENVWPACGISSDGCCGPECSSANDTDCSVAVKCWSAEYQYLFRRADQAKKFCKCAQGNYGYKNYSYTLGWKTVYKYLDIGDNTNWAATPVSSNLPIYQVTCLDSKTYPTNQNYYCSK